MHKRDGVGEASILRGNLRLLFYWSAHDVKNKASQRSV
jgi:hypothetical protein